jgi:hypothetical protein
MISSLFLSFYFFVFSAFFFFVHTFIIYETLPPPSLPMLNYWTHWSKQTPFFRSITFLLRTVQIPKKTDKFRNSYSLQYHLYYTENFVQRVKQSGTVGEMIPATD